MWKEGRLKVVQTSRVMDQDLLTQRSIRHPVGQHIQQCSVVKHGNLDVGPVEAPQHTLMRLRV
ncbi:MAG: hypothetical protein ACJAWL_000066 [Motiliproteus sp.]|jgi:hypothetical protein